MNIRDVKVDIKRSYNGKIKGPPVRMLDENELIDSERLLDEGMTFVSGVSFPFYFSKITGLTLKARRL